ncbi:hypothetical protein PRK78_005820 [Emydomyces testavorans]|uniref:Prenylated Rab acceptor 1 n=1 Tax=Emydomyces testavorans TaxID=2070801 RepID=A0AAF0DP64_9EURO|nr:hypothetical protein PRK78_005820 [Emydomyces testavorans]
MPQWGRPPGARMGRSKRGGKDRWNESHVEELGSDEDSDGEEGVPLDPRIARSRQQRDQLRLTGSADVINEEPSEIDEDSSDDEHNEYALDEAYQDSTVAYAIQLAMKDKEEQLVERALERIKRAQILGKSKVKLSQRELEALERRRKNEAAKGLRGNKAGRAKGNPLSSPRSNAQWLHEAAYASATEAHSGYYASTVQTSQPRPRTPSVQSLRMQQPGTPPRIPGAYHLQDDPSSRPPSSGRGQPLLRPLPDDPQWVPRSRSSSNAVPIPPSYASYVPAQVITFDPRYPMSANPGYNLSTAPDAMYQPSYRPASRDSYADRTAVNPGAVQTVADADSPKRNSSGSGSDGSDNGVQVDVPKESAATRGRKTNGTPNGKSTRSRRKRK